MTGDDLLTKGVHFAGIGICKAAITTGGLYRL